MISSKGVQARSNTKSIPSRVPIHYEHSTLRSSLNNGHMKAKDILGGIRKEENEKVCSKKQKKYVHEGKYWDQDQAHYMESKQEENTNRDFDETSLGNNETHGGIEEVTTEDNKYDREVKYADHQSKVDEALQETRGPSADNLSGSKLSANASEWNPTYSNAPAMMSLPHPYLQMTYPVHVYPHMYPSLEGQYMMSVPGQFPMHPTVVDPQMYCAQIFPNPVLSPGVLRPLVDETAGSCVEENLDSLTLDRADDNGNTDVDANVEINDTETRVGDGRKSTVGNDNDINKRKGKICTKEKGRLKKKSQVLK